MSNAETRGQLSVPAAQVLGIGTGLVVLLSGGIILRAHGPGRMWLGFITVGIVSLLAFGIAAWRVSRRPGAGTTAERAFAAGGGDERDRTVLQAALAITGLVSLPLTGIATFAIAIGADDAATLAILLWLQLAVLIAAFTACNRRT
jgi:hypothetical protein